MFAMSSLARTAAASAVFLTAALGVSCYSGDATPPDAGDTLVVGTWGGDDAGVIVGDSVAHAHIACTLGNFPAPVALDESGRFSVAGTYVLRAYPVHIGPDLPAQFDGEVRGNRLTLRVSVDDTVDKKIVNLGPVTVTLGREPRMGPCPICRTPGEAAGRTSAPAARRAGAPNE